MSSLSEHEREQAAITAQWEADHPKVQIRFVMFEGECLAVFMGRSAERRRQHSDNRRVRGCYAHVGQHSECFDGMKDKPRATPEQYASLLHELEKQVGYRVTVI